MPGSLKLRLQPELQEAFRVGWPDRKHGQSNSA